MSSVSDAQVACFELARSHYENFPVRSVLLKRAEREDLAAIYAFCRTTDDLGDELAGDRVAALDAWETAVTSALTGQPPADEPVLVALSQTASRRKVSPDLFLRIVEANRRDQTVHRYPDTDALLEYCSYSATPVGRMVLAVIDHGQGQDPLSDATCIGLQLVNFWQDLRRDWDKGRCYLPLDACARHGVEPSVELCRAIASPALIDLVEEQVGAARQWLQKGWSLADSLPVRWRPIVRGFTRGGWATCDAIEAQGFDTLRERPVLSRRARTAIMTSEMLRAPRRGVRLDSMRP
jgi:squalene synthase HpnC